jgi:hypothetical protein
VNKKKCLSTGGAWMIITIHRDVIKRAKYIYREVFFLGENRGENKIFLKILELVGRM